MLFNRAYVQNSRVARVQLENRDAMRNAANAHERTLEASMRIAMGRDFRANSGLIPRDVYQEFDNSTIEIMRLDDGDVFLNDLLPLAKSVNIGKLTYVTRRASDAGVVQTSMSGQIGIKMDQVEYDYDGTVIPVHDTGFSRNWRELNAQRAEGFDALIDDQRESTKSLRARLCDTFLDGQLDKDGNYIVVDTRQWQGMRNDTRVEQVDLGAAGVNFDFTSGATTGDANKAALITVIDFIRITNKCGRDLTLYISKEIMSNWERSFSANYDGKDIIDQLAKLSGIAAIKSTNKLTGNQLMGFPLDKFSVIPVTGMGMSTLALPRPMYNSNYDFVNATASGWIVKTDYASTNTCAFYASA